MFREQKPTDNLSLIQPLSYLIEPVLITHTQIREVLADFKKNTNFIRSSWFVRHSAMDDLINLEAAINREELSDTQIFKLVDILLNANVKSSDPAHQVIMNLKNRLNMDERCIKELNEIKQAGTYDAVSVVKVIAFYSRLKIANEILGTPDLGIFALDAERRRRQVSLISSRVFERQARISTRKTVDAAVLVNYFVKSNYASGRKDDLLTIKNLYAVLDSPHVDTLIKLFSQIQDLLFVVTQDQFNLILNNPVAIQSSFEGFYYQMQRNNKNFISDIDKFGYQVILTYVIEHPAETAPYEFYGLTNRLRDQGILRFNYKETSGYKTILQMIFEHPQISDSINHLYYDSSSGNVLKSVDYSPDETKDSDIRLQNYTYYEKRFVAFQLRLIEQAVGSTIMTEVGRRDFILPVLDYLNPFYVAKVPDKKDEELVADVKQSVSIILPVNKSGVVAHTIFDLPVSDQKLDDSLKEHKVNMRL
jgi:hypothetical protein